MSQKPVPDDEKRIMEHVSFLNEMMQAIRDINRATAARHPGEAQDPIDVAENLITNLPSKWESEVESEIAEAKVQFLHNIGINAKYFTPGILRSIKNSVSQQNFDFSKHYARQIKRIGIDLMDKKEILFQTKKQVEQGYLSLYELGEGEQEDE